MFNCQSEMVHKRWFSLDLMGVSVGLIGCYFPGAYYAFHCHLVREGAWVGVGGCVCATSVRTTMDESTYSLNLSHLSVCTSYTTLKCDIINIYHVTDLFSRFTSIGVLLQ